MKAVAGLGRQTRFIHRERVFEPGVPRDERAARRLAGTADELRRKEFCNRGLELGFGIGPAVRRKKKSGLDGSAFNTEDR